MKIFNFILLIFLISLIILFILLVLNANYDLPNWMSKIINWIPLNKTK
ncbi:hypothetical protein [Mycoplasmopsis lipofaciens]|nr:hypothetical protein [Mycoplasmopsis lipofaciens]